MVSSFKFYIFKIILIANYLIENDNVKNILTIKKNDINIINPFAINFKLEIKSNEQFNNVMRIAEYQNFWHLETFRNVYTKT